MAKTKQKFVSADHIQNRLAALAREQAQLQALDKEQPKRIIAFMAALGNTDRKIAASLRKLGIKAVKGNPYKCALAVALKKEFRQPVAVRGADSITVDGYRVVTINNQAVRNFILKFDTGRYPSLMK